jgi:uncharacterized protein YjdB
MLDRSCLSALLLTGLILPIAGCGTSMVDSLAVTPATQSVAVGQTAQFTATGTYSHGSHPSTTQDVTDQSTWVSSAPAVATVDSSGVATAVSAGTATISASIAGYTGILSSSAVLTVTSSSSGVGGDIVSVAVIPGSQSVATPNQNTQFLAIGTNAAGSTVNVTSQSSWYSSDTAIASINAATGVASSVSQGTTTVTAIVTNTDNTVAAGIATLTVLNGSTETITALTIIPDSESLSAEGQTSQLVAIGTSGTSGLQLNLTSSPQLTWGSSIPTIASVSTTGLVTGLSVGSTTITALYENHDTTVVSAPPATITTTNTAAPEPLLSLTVIPSSITVDNLQGTGNFLAVGTFSTTPNVRDLTNSVTWLSSEPDVFPVDTNSSPPNPGAPAGLVTAYGSGSAVIIAEATDPTTGSIQTATATFNCPLVLPNPEGNPPTPGSCYPGSQAPGLKVTLTIYNEGLNTTNWLVTAPSATGTPDVIHCGPGWAADGNTGGSVCTAAYPFGTDYPAGTTVLVTAPAQAGVAFGGWSWTCTPTAPITAAGPNSCTVTLGEPNPLYNPSLPLSSTNYPYVTSNITVGAIFN